jgi:hypothetical protein
LAPWSAGIGNLLDAADTSSGRSVTDTERGADGHRDRPPDVHTDRDSDIHTDVHIDSYAYRDAGRNIHIYASRDALGNTDSNHDSGPHVHCDTGCDTHGHSDGYRHCGGHSHPYGHTDRGTGRRFERRSKDGL